ncbi:MAG: phosphatase PAP2 family protein [Candidatus Nitrosothermus koennekii]|nr:MAG: phosphatase PAP2 family protein [Candidatus Nitrosothermus koennekii]
MIRDELMHINSRLFLSLVIAFIALTIIVASKAIDELDDNIVRNAVASTGNPAIDMIMIIFSTIADIFPFYFSPIIIISIIMLIKRKSRKAGAILLISLVVGVVIVAQFKQFVDRERPNYEFKPNIGFEFIYEQDVLGRSKGSYPSGHATWSTIFAYITAYLLRNYKIKGIKIAYLLWILPIMVGISRVYIGAHYPTDVIGGMLLGIIISNLLAVVLKIDKPITTNIGK